MLARKAKRFAALMVQANTHQTKTKGKNGKKKKKKTACTQIYVLFTKRKALQKRAYVGVKEFLLYPNERKAHSKASISLSVCGKVKEKFQKNGKARSKF